MKVLITGSSGRLGKAIAALLKEKGIKSVGCDLVPSKTTDLSVDIRDRKEVFRIVKKVDHVIHTAAMHGRHTIMNIPRIDFVQTNIHGTLNLLDASAKYKIRSFVFTSTSSVYGKSMENKSETVWVDEELPAVARDIYDITKLAAENLCRDYFEKEKLNGCALRVSRFMDEPLNNIANYRLYRGLDERDAAEAHWLALNKKFKTFEVFNISNDTPFKRADIKDLKKAARKLILKYHPESEAIYKQNKWKFPETIDRVYSIEKAKRILKYKPKNNFMEFIKAVRALKKNQNS